MAEGLVPFGWFRKLIVDPDLRLFCAAIEDLADSPRSRRGAHQRPRRGQRGGNWPAAQLSCHRAEAQAVE